MNLGRVRGVARFKGRDPLYLDVLFTGEDVGMERDNVSELIGDGNARVTVSMDLKDSDFGSGFSGFVSVSLACNQDDETIEEAASIAQEMVTEYVPTVLEAAEEQYKEFKRSRKRKKRSNE